MAQDSRYAWRGVANTAWRVQSSLYRNLLEVKGHALNPNEDRLREEEILILEEARKWGLGRSGTHQLNDLQLLAVLQHNGVPTRLLDVTSDPLTALWFACSLDPEDDGLLMAFNIADYGAVQSEEDKQPWESWDDPAGWHLKDVLKQSAEMQRPFVMRPTFLDGRMAAQEGFFLLSACPASEIASPNAEYREIPRPGVDGMYLGRSDYIPMHAAEEMLFTDAPEFDPKPQSIWSFVIGSHLKTQILGALDRNFSKRASILFPDVAGFRDDARANWLR